MPKRIPVQTIFVQRDGKNFKPPIGKIFDFTAEELDDINKVNPGAVRKPTVETEVEAPAPVETAAARKVREAAEKKAADEQAAADKKAGNVAKKTDAGDL